MRDQLLGDLHGVAVRHLRPPVGGHLALAGVERDHQAVARGGRWPNRAGPGPRGPRCRPRPGRRPSRARSRWPAASAARRRSGPCPGKAAAMLATSAACTGSPSRAPSRSTTWSDSAPCSAKARAWATGSSLKTGRLVEVALAQAHRLAPLEVDRGVERDHECETTPARTAASQRDEQPEAGDARLLGVELHAQDALAPRGRAELDPVGGAAQHQPLVLGLAGVGVHEVVGGVGRRAGPGGQRRVRRPSGPRSIRCGAA